MCHCDFLGLQHLEIMATAINCSDLLHSLLFESPDLRYFYFETLDVDLNQADYVRKLKLTIRGIYLHWAEIVLL